MIDVLGSADLPPQVVDALVDRAEELAAGSSPSATRFGVCTVFMSASTRTRIGFQSAASRMGGWYVAVDELRFDPAMSASESFADAARTLSGMCDVLVVRGPLDLASELPPDLAVPVINAGDSTSHPTQALIDLATIRRLAGPEAGLRIGLCGDLGMRAARSLLDVLSGSRPRELRLIHPEDRGADMPAGLEGVAVTAGPGELADLDVLVVVGLPPRGRGVELGDADRQVFALDAAGLDRLPPHAIVLSPMPVIDEITPEARDDPRIRMFEQSDHGVFVRMALLEHVFPGG